jgi:hypothetical protein
MRQRLSAWVRALTFLAVLPRRERNPLHELVEDRCALCGAIAAGRDARSIPLVGKKRFVCFACSTVRRLYFAISAVAACVLVILIASALIISN